MQFPRIFGSVSLSKPSELPKVNWTDLLQIRKRLHGEALNAHVHLFGNRLGDLFSSHLVVGV